MITKAKRFNRLLQSLLSISAACFLIAGCGGGGTSGTGIEMNVAGDETSGAAAELSCENVPGSSSCGDTAYCAFPEESCGEDGQAGTCMPRAEICSELFAPVCGCDGSTYGNECFASAGGTSVRSQGSCETS